VWFKADPLRAAMSASAGCGHDLLAELRQSALTTFGGAEAAVSRMNAREPRGRERDAVIRALLNSEYRGPLGAPRWRGRYPRRTSRH
jgi:hypothetical protein